VQWQQGLVQRHVELWGLLGEPDVRHPCVVEPAGELKGQSGAVQGVKDLLGGFVMMHDNM
jgi:hypothetical protein